MSEQITSTSSSVQTGTSKKQLTYIEFLDTSPMTGFRWLLLFGLCLAQLLDGMARECRLAEWNLTGWLPADGNFKRVPDWQSLFPTCAIISG